MMGAISDTVIRRIHAMPKVELHIHLEGSTTPAMLFHLHERNGLPPPAESPEALAEQFRFRDFSDFVDMYLVILNAIRTADDFAYLVYELGRDRARQNILYSEVTVTPYAHIWMDKGLAPEDIIEGLEEGRRRVREEFRVELRWIVDIPRSLPEPAATWTADWAIAWQDRGVVALGLGGPEAGYPPEHFAHAFARARAAGLHSAPHAGETAGPSSVWGALHALAAERIGHGVRAVEDPLLLAYLREHQIPLEVNPTSNVQLQVYPSLEQHPFPHLWRMGLYLTVNSDDPPLFHTTLTEEYIRLVQTFGFTWEDVTRWVHNAARAAFLDPVEKDALVQRIATGISSLE
ncbi:MAG: adenosine deaminase [Chloroflexi bacterium]|nr:adenosine deaminase [Chloroflexota bacterium]